MIDLTGMPLANASLLDEATANLDDVATAAVEDLVADYQRKNGAAVIWVSHSRSQMERVADVVFKMEDRELKEVPKE